MRVVSASQLTLEFQPSVRQRHRTLRQCVAAAVLASPKGAKQIAADCDISESELSRRLAPKSERDPRSCDVDLMVAVMRSTGDLSPLQWLLAEFTQDDDARLQSLAGQVEQALPVLLEFAQAMKRGKR